MKALLALFNFSLVIGFAWLAGVDPKRGVIQAVVLAVALMSAYAAKFQVGPAVPDRPPGPGATNTPKPPTPFVAGFEPNPGPH